MTRQASNEGYYAVLKQREEGRIEETDWRVYEALWHKGPLSAKGLLEVLTANGYTLTSRGVTSTLRALAALGLVEEVKKVFDVTAATVLREVVPPAKKPPRKKFAKGVEDLELCYVRGERLNFVSPEAKQVLEWLKGKVA